jgi:PAS domain-containing protein
VQDDTDPKHSEERLRESELRYRRLFESAKDGILILDAKTGKITNANPFLVDLLDYSPR